MEHKPEDKKEITLPEPEYLPLDAVYWETFFPDRTRTYVSSPVHASNAYSKTKLYKRIT